MIRRQGLEAGRGVGGREGGHKEGGEGQQGGGDWEGATGRGRWGGGQWGGREKRWGKHMECLGEMRLQFFSDLLTRATPGTPASRIYE